MLSDVISNITEMKGTGRRIYGIMAHGLIPEELIYAIGGFPLRLSLAGDETSSNKGIEYITSATCSFARSTIGYFALNNELYKELNAIVGGNYCNGELCATELISEYFDIPRINIVFPSTKNEFAMKFMAAELNHFKDNLEKFEGKQITDDQISLAIQFYNEERKSMQEIVKLQTKYNFVLSGLECQDLMYKHFLYGVKTAMENYQTLIAELGNKTQKAGKKIIFAGNGVPIGDNIIRLIEDMGLLVIKNLTWTGLDYYNSLVDEDKNPLEALAEYYVNSENTGRMILSQNYLTSLINTYEDSNAEGIVFYKVKYCSILPAVLSAKLKESLSKKGIPYLEIEREYGATTDAQLQTKLQAFKEMIE